MEDWTKPVSCDDFDDLETPLETNDSRGLRAGEMPEDSNSGTPNPRSNPCIFEPRDYIEDERVILRRRLGVTEAVGIVLGIIVGSGIFISPADVSRNTGSAGEALLVWTFCGAISTIGALCFAELGLLIPKSGGDYTYLYEIFGPFWGFLRLWIELIVVRPSSHAIIALTFAYYAIQPFFPNGGVPPGVAVQLLGSACILFLTWLNCTSVKWAAKIQVVFTIAEIAVLLLIIILGVIEISKGHVEQFQSDVIFKGSLFDPGKLAMAMYAGLWAFSGWNELNYVVDEIKNPSRNLPLAIAISISVASILYVAVNVSYFTLLSPKEMKSQEATAVLFGKLALGSYSYIIPICVALCCFGGINGSLFTASRFFYVGACNGHLPVILSMINIHSASPVPTLLLTGVLSVLYMATNDVFALINYCNFVYFFAMGFAILGLVVIRIKNPNRRSSFQLPLILPCIAVFVCIATGILSFIQAPTESAIGIGMVCTAVPVYFLFVVAPRPTAIERFLDKLTTVLQYLTQSVAEEK